MGKEENNWKKLLLYLLNDDLIGIPMNINRELIPNKSKYWKNILKELNDEEVRIFN